MDNDKKLKEKQIEDAKKQRTIAREKLLPILQELDETNTWVKMFCGAIGSLIQYQITEECKNRTFNSLEFMKNIKEDHQDYEKYKKVYDILAKETIADVLTIINQLPNAIESYNYIKTKDLKLKDISLDEIIQPDEKSNQ